MESKNSSLLLKSSLCLAHTIHIPDFWLEIRLNMDVLYVRTFTTANFLYLTAPLQPMLQAGFLRWYLFRCDYLLIYNETLGGKVLILSNLTSIYERKYFKARNILNLFALMLRMVSSFCSTACWKSKWEVLLHYGISGEKKVVAFIGDIGKRHLCGDRLTWKANHRDRVFTKSTLVCY